MVLARTYLIRPPSARFTFTGLHGIDWERVRDAPTFADLWPTLGSWIKPAAFAAAHNAAFDRSVLHACCARYGLLPTRNAFVCTVELARRQWSIYPTTLPDVCRALRIGLQHHDAGQDAVACARIVLAAEAVGWRHRRPPPRSAGVVPYHRSRVANAESRPPACAGDLVAAPRLVDLAATPGRGGARLTASAGWENQPRVFLCSAWQGVARGLNDQEYARGHHPLLGQGSSAAA